MVLGVVAYGYIIASVAASLANADSARAQYQEKLKAVKSYMAVCAKNSYAIIKLQRAISLCFHLHIYRL